MVDYFLIVFGIILGGFFALMAFGAGKLGQQGEGTFNWIKAAFCMIVGGIFGAWTAYNGGTIDPDLIAQLFSATTIGGFGVVWLIDTIVQMITSYIAPQTPLTQGMAIRPPQYP